MTHQCTICQSEIFTPEAVERLQARRKTRDEERDLASELEKGYMVCVCPCGHCFHEACIDHWIDAEYETKVRSVIQAIQNAVENGILSPHFPPDFIEEVRQSIEYR
jgi:hypothetical protein